MEIKFFHRSFGLCALLICFLFSNALLANEADNDSRDDTRTYHAFENVDLVSTLKIDYAVPRIVIKAVYPQLQTELDTEFVNSFNQMVVDVIQQEIDSFPTQVATYRALQLMMPKKQVRNDLYVDYDAAIIQAAKTHIASIRFTFQTIISGREKAIRYHKVLNYDLENNQKIELSDLFQKDSNYLEFLSDYSQHVLNKRLENRDMIALGTLPTEDNFKNWNIKHNGLLITFPASQVAPYIYGAQTVLIPYSSLRELLDTRTPIAKCLNRKRRCVRTNLLTGGFIDEAKKESPKDEQIYFSHAHDKTKKLLSLKQ